MARFTEEVTVVNRLSGRVHEWTLCQPLSYRIVDLPESEVVNVPAGLVTDFASVPRPFWFWVAPWGRHGRAALVHDHLYRLGSVTDPVARSLRRPSKREADRIFRQAIAVLDRTILGRSRFWNRVPRPIVEIRIAISGFRRWVMWAAIAIFGRWAYKRGQALGDVPPLEHEMLVEVEQMVNNNNTSSSARSS
jgi:hypothetical protein